MYTGCTNVYTGCKMCTQAARCVHRLQNVYTGCTMRTQAVQCVHRLHNVYTGCTMCTQAAQCVHRLHDVYTGCTMCTQAAQCAHILHNVYTCRLHNSVRVNYVLLAYLLIRILLILSRTEEMLIIYIQKSVLFEILKNWWNIGRISVEY